MVPSEPVGTGLESGTTREALVGLVACVVGIRAWPRLRPWSPIGVGEDDKVEPVKTIGRAGPPLFRLAGLDPVPTVARGRASPPPFDILLYTGRARRNG